MAIEVRKSNLDKILARLWKEEEVKDKLLETFQIDSKQEQQDRTHRTQQKKIDTSLSLMKEFLSPSIPEWEKKLENIKFKAEQYLAKNNYSEVKWKTSSLGNSKWNTLIYYDMTTRKSWKTYRISPAIIPQDTDISAITNQLQ